MNQMNLENLNKIIIVFLFFISVSCIEDKGKYEYHNIHSVDIKGIANSYTVALASELKINPQLFVSVSDDRSVSMDDYLMSDDADEFEYQWHRVGGPYLRSTGIISRERNLDIAIGAPWFPQMNTYYVLYCVFNKTTGVRYDRRFTLNVQDEMLVGYVMLCETKENFDLDLISLYRDTLTQYHKVLDLMQSDFPREGRTAIDVVSYRDPASPMIRDDSNYKNHALWILTDQGSERVRVENFEWKPDFDIRGISMVLDKFLNGEKFIAQKMFASGYTSISSSNWIYDKAGNWYWYNWAAVTNFCVNPINRTRSTDMPYKTAPYIFAFPDACAVLFNEDANRFEAQSANASGSTELLWYTIPLTGTAIFDWQNPNYRLVYMGNRTRSRGFAIVRNVQTTRYEYLYFYGSSMSSQPTKDDRKDFPLDDSVPFEDFTHFALHSETPYLFAATENQLYRIDVTMMPQAGWRDVTAQALPEGHMFSKVVSSINFPRTDLIAVCTYDPFGTPGENGRLAFYNVEHGTGDLIPAKHPAEPLDDGYQIDMKWGGFGKIIGVDYRNVQ